MLVVTKKLKRIINLVGIVVISAIWLSACDNQGNRGIDERTTNGSASENNDSEGPPGSVVPPPPPPYLE